MVPSIPLCKQLVIPNEECSKDHRQGIKFNVPSILFQEPQFTLSHPFYDPLFTTNSLSFKLYWVYATMWDGKQTEKKHHI